MRLLGTITERCCYLTIEIENLSLVLLCFLVAKYVVIFDFHCI